jgi:hypothetical protein
VITNEMGLKYQDAHWYLNKNLFISKFKYDDLIQSIKKQTNEFKRRLTQSDRHTPTKTL